MATKKKQTESADMGMDVQEYVNKRLAEIADERFWKGVDERMRELVRNFASMLINTGIEIGFRMSREVADKFSPKGRNGK